MLSTVSWGEFFTFLFIGLVLYYGWWLWRFGSTLGRSADVPSATAGRKESSVVHIGQTGKGQEEADRKPDQAVVKAGASEGSPAGEHVGLPSPSPLPDAVQAVPRVHLALLAGEASAKINELADRAAAGELAIPEFEFAIRVFLNEEPFCQLRRSDYYVRINEVLLSALRLRKLGEADMDRVRGLWIK